MISSAARAVPRPHAAKRAARSPARRRKRTPIVVAIACFVVGAAAARWVVDAVFPREPPVEIELRLADLAGYPDVGLLLVGTSLTQSGIVPDLLDAELARRGHPVRSYNFGIRGMGPIEADYVLRQILQASPPPRLRRVVLEGGAFTAIPFTAGTNRELYWHDGPHTRMALDTLLGLRRLGQPIETSAFLDHARLFARRTVRLGEALPARERPEVADLPHPGWRGWNLPRGAVIDTAAYLREVHRLAVLERQGAQAPDPRFDPLRLDLRRRQVAHLAARGIEVYFVAPPTAAEVVDPRLTLWAERQLPGYLAFNTPLRYPQLYALDGRADRNHLGVAGARLFTVELARRLADRFDRAVTD